MNYLCGGVVTDDEFYKLDMEAGEDDNQRVAEILHYIADVVNSGSLGR